MNKYYEGLSISESEYDLENGEKGKIAVFLYTGKFDPSKILDLAISKYVNDKEYYELMETSLSNPWMRVILSNINDIKQNKFDDTFSL